VEPLKSASAAAEATFVREKLRGPFMGILEAGWQAVPLLVAIRYFDAPETIKAFIAGAGPIGFLLTPLTLYLAACSRAKPSLIGALLFVLAGILIAGAGLAQSLLTFALCIIASQMISVQSGPLMVQVYTTNYPADQRGQRVATPLVLIALGAIVFSWMTGELLDLDIANYRWIFAIMTAAALLSAAILQGIPSSPLSTQNVGNPWQNFSLVWKDRFFGYLLFSWMLLGLGNLIALPIRLEYLANPDYGIDASNKTIAILMILVPFAARMASTHLWGRLFDRMHFVTTRNLLNLCFLTSIGLFFFTTNLILLGVAMAFQGIAMGGGKIFWGLWVTKIAPPEKTSSYMSIHMALTGLRGTLAPFIGYWILSGGRPETVALVGMALVAAAIVLFEQIRRHPRLALDRSVVAE
jgi:MFS family permease